MEYDVKIAISFHLRKYIFILLVFTFSKSLYSQVLEDFESTDLSTWQQAPTLQWDTSSSEALNGNFSLKHVFDNSEAANSSISLQHENLLLDADTSIWEFKIRHGFDPSSSNNWAVYLASEANAANIISGSSNNAFLLGVNITGSDDSLKLYKQNGVQKTKIVTTSINWQQNIGPDSVMHLKVSRSPEGIWNVFSIANPMQANLIGTAFDDFNFVSNYFGLYYEYTQTRDQALWFDNLSIEGFFYTDTIPARIESSYFLSEDEIYLSLSEAIERDSLSLESFQIPDNSIDSIEVVSATELVVHTINSMRAFDTLYLNFTTYDLAGNISSIALKRKTEIPSFRDILINEVMADPTPSIGLPVYEYLELFNHSETEFFLRNWQVSINSKKYNLPDLTIQAQQYILLAHEEALSEYSDSITAVSVLSGSYAISNTEAEILLLNHKEAKMDSVFVHVNQHDDAEKSEGGYSLELIDPEYSCFGNNFKSSESSLGGTPGYKNTVYSIEKDTIAPLLAEVEIQSDTSIFILFSEPIQSNLLTLQIEQNNENKHIESINFIEDTSIELNLSSSISDGELRILLTNVTDYCGNIADFDTTINYTIPQQFELLIAELMVDPEPNFGLSGYEYIELYNNSERDINCGNCKLQVNSSVVEIPEFMLPKAGYLVLSDFTSDYAFNDSIHVVFMNLPALPNDGAFLAINNQFDTTIHAIEYNKQWYNNSAKDEGGYSLEMIDSEFPCMEITNWNASENKHGGTPGYKNSVREMLSDNIKPFVHHTVLINDSLFKVCFNEPLLENNLKVESNSQLDIYPFNALNKCFYFQLKSALDSNDANKIEISNSNCDCAGNAFKDSTNVVFAIPSLKDLNSTILNEIYFNPYADEDDYIEIYNGSDNIVSLNDLYLASSDEYGDLSSDPILVSNEKILFYPNEYLALTPDTISLAYNHLYKGKLLQVGDLPSMPDDEGNISLMTRENTIIESLNYSEDWHSSWLVDAEGVSLERLNPAWEANNESHWFSASEQYNFATPGFKNSVYTETKTSESNFSIENELFIPESDGENSFLQIQHRNTENTVVNISIFNSNGQRIKRLKESALLGSEGVITWDGYNDSNYPCAIGIYIIAIETYYEDGSIKMEKLSCVLGKKL
jgi:hypothetical protein